ncbi:MAG TPA: acyl-CoA dehydrogenase family protein [Povalibacter sp.]|nr:acyl-CoA dehydrogenase family protein [Povalibacter sp.]
MTALPDEDQSIFRDAVHRFLAERAPVACLRRLRDTNDATGFDRALWKEMAELGCAGVLIPDSLGGAQSGFVGAGLIAQAVGRHLSVTPMVSTAIAATTALLRGGSAQQQQRWLPAIASGEAVLSVALDERSRHAPLHVATVAVRDGADYRLSGTKLSVLDGHVADALIVPARIGGDADAREGIAAFLIERSQPGVSIQRTARVDSHNAATVTFDDVRVPAGAMLTQASGAEIIDAALSASRAVLAAELLGIAEEAFERTLNYLREREQFGVKIGTFQALQHRAAHLFCEIELVRSAVFRALHALDAEEKDAERYVLLAKAKAGEVARLATNEAVQMHGGIGMTDEFDIGFFMKRARAAGETFGDSYFCADRYAEFSGY